MDARRFDGFARSLALWSSRRKLLGGLAGAGAGRLLLNSDRVLAATCEPAGCPEAGCPAAGAADLSTVAQLSAKKLPIDKYPEPERTNEIRPRFRGFVQQVQDLLDDGAAAKPECWDQGRLDGFMREAKGIVLTSSVVITDAVVAVPINNEPTESTPTPESQTSMPPGCAAKCIGDALDCYNTCSNVTTCYTCFTKFVDCYIGTTNPDGTPDSSGCLEALQHACQGDCCLAKCS